MCLMTRVGYHQPVAMVSSKYSFDDIVEGGGAVAVVPVPLPDTDIEEGISGWFRDLTYLSLKMILDPM